MRFTFNAQLLQLSVPKWKKIMDSALRDALTEGTILWMNAAMASIPVWSGASHGTFLKLASKIGYSLSVGGGVPWLQGPSYGKANSNAKLTVFDGAYVVEYYTSLWHLVWNEYNNGNANPEAGRVFWRLLKPGPYNFQKKAGETFKAFAKEVRLPHPKLATSVKHKVIK